MSWFKKNVYLPLPISKWERLIKFIDENEQRELRFEYKKNRQNIIISLEGYKTIYADNIEEMADKLPAIKNYLKSYEELKK